MDIKNITRHQVAELLPERKKDTYKGDYGRVMIVGGCMNYTGAPYFATQAAINSGSGLVFLALPGSIHQILAGKLNEAIFLPQEEDENGRISVRAAEQLTEEIAKYDVCLAGPGLGRGKGVKRLVKLLLTRAEIPLVLDADCLNELSDDVGLLKRAKSKVIITPHEGEFKRLCPDFDRVRRAEFASAFAKEYGCITVLKGAGTVIALPDGTVYKNTTGNPGMAKGGSGDVLAGIITSLVGQGIEPEKAAYIGVWLHGRAGDLSAERLGEYGMTPTDMLSDIKIAMRDCHSL